jgi:hypothetical protein
MQLVSTVHEACSHSDSEPRRIIGLALARLRAAVEEAEPKG